MLQQDGSDVNDTLFRIIKVDRDLLEHPRTKFKTGRRLLFISLLIAMDLHENVSTKDNKIEAGSPKKKELDTMITNEEAVCIDEHHGTGELEVIRIREGSSILRKLRAAESWMDKKWKIEGMGAERILENERRPPKIANVSQLEN